MGVLPMLRLFISVIEFFMSLRSLWMAMAFDEDDDDKMWRCVVLLATRDVDVLDFVVDVELLLLLLLLFSTLSDKTF